METSMSTYSLVAATLFLAIIVVAGIRERIVNIPRWFANPPVSFGLINEQAKGAVRFWIPIQILFFSAMITAFVTNWHGEVRNYLILTSLCYAVVILTTALYFVKEIMAFSKMQPEEPLTPELKARADKWLKLTGIRNVLQCIGLIILILALV